MSVTLLPSESFQLSSISSSFHSVLLTIFLSGTYTTAYGCTMYLYLRSKASRRSYIVLSLITVLFITNIAQMALQWFAAAQLLTVIGQPVSSSFLVLYEGPGWGIITTDILVFLTSSVADTLLIWRCYHVWDRSFRWIAPSLVLLVAEISLYLAYIIGFSAQHLFPSYAASVILNNLLSAAIFMTVPTTILTTLLIIYRIYSTTRSNAAASARQHASPFIQIAELLIQSSAAYAVVSLLYSVSAFLVVHNALQLGKLEMGNWTGSFFINIAGLAPTLMVARLALAGKKPVKEPDTVGVSALDFNVNDGGMSQLESSHTEAMMSSHVRDHLESWSASTEQKEKQGAENSV